MAEIGLMTCMYKLKEATGEEVFIVATVLIVLGVLIEPVGCSHALVTYIAAGSAIRKW